MKEHYLSYFQKQKDGLCGKEFPWLKRIREEAISVFAKTGFPTTKDERWKHTDVSSIVQIPFELGNGAKKEFSNSTLDPFFPKNSKEFSSLFFVNGKLDQERSNLNRLEGVKVKNFSQALREDNDLLRKVFESQTSFKNNPFLALNAAFMENGAFVFLPTSKRLEYPIYLIFVSSPTNDLTSFYSKNIVFAQEGSQASIVEMYVGPEKNRYFVNTATQIIVEVGASIEHTKIQLESEDAFHIGAVSVLQNRSSQFTSQSLSFGGALTRNDFCSVLNEEGGECSLNGLYIAKGKQHVDHYTTIDHAKPHCMSRELYKGILDGHGHGVFTGKIIVRKDAQKSDAYQMNRNLLLSKDALIDTTPQLEIFANDVKCSHGATVGKLDEDELFYLRSRGLELNTARNLLVQGYTNEVIDLIKNKNVQQHVKELVLQRLGA